MYQFSLQLGHIPMPNIRPLLDVVEIHHPVRSAESSQGIFPVSILANFWVPFDKVVNFLGHLSFQSVDNDTSD